MVKYLNLIVLGMLMFGIFVTLSLGSSTALTVYSPFPGEHVALICSKELILNISVYDPVAPEDSTVAVTISGPYDIKMTSAGVPIGQLNASHMLTVTDYEFPVTLFEANGTQISAFIPGQYNVTISVAGCSETIPIYVISPNEIEFLVYVYSNGLPLSGVTVSIYNVTNGGLLLTNTTNSQGLAELTVPYVYTMTNEYNITAVKPGYQLVYDVVTVPADHITPVTVKLTTKPITFVLTPVYFQDMGVTEPAEPAQLPGTPELVYIASAYMGTTFSIIINATESGMPVQGATISASYMINGKQMSSTATYIGNGQYNLSIILPNSTVPYDLELVVTGSYQTNTYTFVTLLSVQPNVVGEIQYLQSEVNNLETEVTTLESEILSLNETIMQQSSEIASLKMYLEGNVSYFSMQISNLESEIKYLNSTLMTLSSELTTVNSTLSNEVNSLTAEVHSLSTQVSTLSTELNNLNTTVNNLNANINNDNSKISSLTTLVYGGIILGVIALIIAIVAVVLVFRKVA
ncbi:s-layer glycosylated protein, SlaB [Acidianus hospitalis W1]|uniref:S-layer glycosylated protein, SlaB n=1 Tax=Acidianus hospitalis (strain W1) TaxID=933801 RepID=F4B9B0_ACIHW|nr:carboxypeptidase-like regulatory domain-containing protein [Acidianus hospitalis]AEE93903.1 s-layer glycosylated protein, SlaB [Acidianus hospitalis W1]